MAQRAIVLDAINQQILADDFGRGLAACYVYCKIRAFDEARIARDVNATLARRWRPLSLYVVRTVFIRATDNAMLPVNRLRVLHATGVLSDADVAEVLAPNVVRLIAKTAWVIQKSVLKTPRAIAILDPEPATAARMDAFLERFSTAQQTT